MIVHGLLHILAYRLLRGKRHDLFLLKQPLSRLIMSHRLAGLLLTSLISALVSFLVNATLITDPGIARNSTGSSKTTDVQIRWIWTMDLVVIRARYSVDILRRLLTTYTIATMALLAVARVLGLHRHHRAAILTVVMQTGGETTANGILRAHGLVQLTIALLGPIGTRIDVLLRYNVEDGTVSLTATIMRLGTSATETGTTVSVATHHHHHHHHHHYHYHQHRHRARMIRALSARV